MTTALYKRFLEHSQLLLFTAKLHEDQLVFIHISTATQQATIADVLYLYRTFSILNPAFLTRQVRETLTTISMENFSSLPSTQGYFGFSQQG
jgi:hypothetical protein